MSGANRKSMSGKTK